MLVHVLTISNLLRSFIAYTFFDALCLTWRRNEVKQYIFILIFSANETARMIKLAFDSTVSFKYSRPSQALADSSAPALGEEIAFIERLNTAIYFE